MSPAEPTREGSHRSKAGLAPGVRAPSFLLPWAPHARIALQDLAGRPLVVVFHVADWQPTASEQLRQYEEILPQIRLLNARIVAISPDSVWSHRAFAESLGLSFPLLSDDAPWGATAATYRVHPDAQDRRRAVFVIDHEGVIRWAGVYPDAINPGVDGVLSALEGMRAAAA